MVKCECDGFEDAYSHSSGHYTITVHDEDCPNNPENWEIEDGPDWDAMERSDADPGL